MNRRQLLRAAPALGSVALLPLHSLAAEMPFRRERQMTMEKNDRSERFGNAVLESLRKVGSTRRLDTLTPAEWVLLGHNFDKLAMEHAYLGNLKKIDDFILTKQAVLKTRAPAEVIDRVTSEGIHRTMHLTANAFRNVATHLETASVPRVGHLVEAKFVLVNRACFWLANGMGAIGIALSFNPFTAPLGVIIGISGIVLDVMEHYEVAC